MTQNCEKKSSLENDLHSKKVWYKKLVQSSHEGCRLALHEHNKKYEWYINSEWSKYMTKEISWSSKNKEEEMSTLETMAQPRS